MAKKLDCYVVEKDAVSSYVKGQAVSGAALGGEESVKRLLRLGAVREATAEEARLAQPTAEDYRAGEVEDQFENETRADLSGRADAPAAPAGGRPAPMGAVRDAAKDPDKPASEQKASPAGQRDRQR